MFKIAFPKSRSKNFAEVLKEARKFDTCNFDGASVTVEILVKDIFQRWDSFNYIFHTVVSWSGSYIEYDGMKYYSHSDKKRLFYSIQQAHSRWMSNVGYVFENSDLIYTGDETLEALEKRMYIESEIDKLLDFLFPNHDGDQDIL